MSIVTTVDLLDAPKLFTQVYCAAKILHDWPHDAAMEAADQAVKEYGESPCGLQRDLDAILCEVLRSD